MSVESHPPGMDVEVASLQRRTVRVLVASQALGGIGVGAGLAVVAPAIWS